MQQNNNNLNNNNNELTDLFRQNIASGRIKIYECKCAIIEV